MKLSNVHARSLETSTALSCYYVMNHITPLDVIAVLNAAGVQFVLVGLHGVAGWMDEPRATQDVDVVVASRHHKKALTALAAAFPNLEPRDFEVVTRLVDQETKKVLIDVMKPNQPLFKAALKHTKEIQSRG